MEALNRFCVGVGVITSGRPLERVLKEGGEFRLGCLAFAIYLWRAFYTQAGCAQQVGFVFGLTLIIEFEFPRTFQQFCPNVRLCLGGIIACVINRGNELLDRGVRISLVELVFARQHCQDLTVVFALIDIAIGVVEIFVEDILGHDTVHVLQAKTVLDLLNAFGNLLRRDTTLGDRSIRPYAGKTRRHRCHRVDVQRHSGRAVRLRITRADTSKIRVEVDIRASRFITVIRVDIGVAHDGDHVGNRALQGNRKRPIGVQRNTCLNELAI